MMDRFPDVHVSCAGDVHVKGRHGMSRDREKILCKVDFFLQM